MDFTRELSKGHSRTITSKIVDYIGEDGTKFKKLVDVFLGGPYRITQRAAWPLSNCVEQYPHLIFPHLTEILRFSKRPGVHDAVKRNTVRLLQFVDIPPRFQGKVWKVCFEFLNDKSQPVAVRCFSMTVLGNIAKDKQELHRELRISIEDQLPYASPGFASRAKKVLRFLR